MKADVAVVGGGPAGAVTAALLARGGASVALIDGSHPREKPCGGGLTGRALAIVSDIVDPHAVQTVHVRRARFLDTARGTDAPVELPRDDDALVVAGRAAFDSALFAAAVKAGAAPFDSRVVRLEHAAAGWTIALRSGARIHAPFVVGADGANSFIRRTVAAPLQRNQLSIATGVYAWGVTGDDIVIEMTSNPPGYIWSFPRADHLAIGICAQASDTTVGALRAVLDRWLETTGLARGARLQPYSWPIPSLAAADFGTIPIASDRWLTAGDAAGLVDPITREGIYFALQSGRVAAEALLQSAVGAGRWYSERVRDEIATELACAAQLKAGFFRPRAIGLLTDALASSARIRAVMADLIAGTQSYRTLKRRLLGTFEIGFAWRWLRQVHRAT